MKIVFEHSPFFQPVTNLLREMERMGFFSHGLLIGSWPMVIYSEHFTLAYGFTTNDIDFAIDSAVKIPATGGETIPELMDRLGYTPVHDYSGIETFIQGTFEIEFITHRRGGKAPPSVVIPPWKVSAQPLPFIDLLFIRPATVVIEDFSIRIPSPEALMLPNSSLPKGGQVWTRKPRKRRTFSRVMSLRTFPGSKRSSGFCRSIACRRRPAKLSAHRARKEGYRCRSWIFEGNFRGVFEKSGIAAVSRGQRLTDTIRRRYFLKRRRPWLQNTIPTPPIISWLCSTNDIPVEKQNNEMSKR